MTYVGGGAEENMQERPTTPPVRSRGGQRTEAWGGKRAVESGREVGQRFAYNKISIRIDIHVL